MHGETLKRVWDIVSSIPVFQMLQKPAVFQNKQIKINAK